jgi:hypothetical protein
MLPFWFATILTYGYLGLKHYSLDLSADAQTAIALVFIPIYAIPVVFIAAVSGTIVSLVLSQIQNRKGITNECNGTSGSGAPSGP